MNGMDKQKFEDYIQEGYNTVPVLRRVDHVLPVPVIYEAFRQDEQETGLLETGRAGRYSYVPLHRIASIMAKKGQVQKDSEPPIDIPLGSDPLDLLQAAVNQWKSPRLDVGPDWCGGALGFFSYDLVRYFESIPENTLDDMGLPDLLFTMYRDLIAIDHQEMLTYFISNVLVDQGDCFEDGIRRVKQMEQQFLLLMDEETPGKVDAASLQLQLQQQQQELNISPSFTQGDFEQAVTRVQDYIRAGDVFQVNLSVRQDFPISSTPWDIYKILRVINPSPYMGYLHYPQFQIVCGSPELLIKVKDRRISTRPIAGTRQRGKDQEEDLRLAHELIDNEKERAEHIMLVDLERNDLGRVCEFGSVKVTDFMVIEEYSHVMHIVSHVEGTLAADQTIYDAVRATFPGGTITGAPKIRTMEIIEELEPVKRGLYTGALGWIGFNGDLEINIVIRTLLAKDGYGHVQAGAGIVIDSKPECRVS